MQNKKGVCHSALHRCTKLAPSCSECQPRVAEKKGTAVAPHPLPPPTPFCTAAKTTLAWHSPFISLLSLRFVRGGSLQRVLAGAQTSSLTRRMPHSRREMSPGRGRNRGSGCPSGPSPEAQARPGGARGWRPPSSAPLRPPHSPRFLPLCAGSPCSGSSAAREQISRARREGDACRPVRGAAGGRPRRLRSPRSGRGLGGGGGGQVRPAAARSTNARVNASRRYTLCKAM